MEGNRAKRFLGTIVNRRPGGPAKKTSQTQNSTPHNLSSPLTDSFNNLFQDFFHRSWVFEILAEQFKNGQPFIHTPKHVRFYFVSCEHCHPHESTELHL